MGGRIGSSLLAGPDVDHIWLEAEAGAVALCQPAELLRAKTLLALWVKGCIRLRPVLVDHRLVVRLRALPGPGARRLFRRAVATDQEARDQQYPKRTPLHCHVASVCL